MTGRLVTFDRTGPDPTRREGDAYRLLFSQRCGMNALETTAEFAKTLEES